ncbi:MAG: hypothetical protein WKF93_02995 [Acidimicrobiales bacterium]
MPTTRVLIPAALAALLTLAACSRGADQTADGDVATLGGDDGADDTADDSGGGLGGATVDGEFQDAMVDFAECMRGEGIDFPDPQIEGEEGDGIVTNAENLVEADLEALEAANEVCSPILEEASRSLPEIDPEQRAEMEEQSLAFAECMREQGIDFPDPVFSDDGGDMTVSSSEEGGAFDPHDEDFAAAAEECGGPGAGVAVDVGGDG